MFLFFARGTRLLLLHQSFKNHFHAALPDHAAGVQIGVLLVPCGGPVEKAAGGSGIGGLQQISAKKNFSRTLRPRSTAAVGYNPKIPKSAVSAVAPVR